MGSNPGVTAWGGSSHSPLCALTGVGHEGLTEQNGMCGYVGVGMGTQEGPGEKEGFLE